jgi:hypothetical protein
MNRKQRERIVTERGRLEKKGYRFLTAQSAADGLIVQVNYEYGRTPIPVGTVAGDDDAIAWRDALDMAVRHNAGAGGNG